MVDQPTTGVSMYAVKCIAGGRPRILHRNLLLPLQGRIRQESGVGGEGGSDSEGEDETPKVARLPCERRTTKLHVNPTQQVDTSVVLSDKNTHQILQLVVQPLLTSHPPLMGTFNLSLMCLILRSPYHLIRQPIMCPLILNQIVTLIVKVLHKLPQEEVSEAPKVHFPCAMGKNIYIAQLSQNCQNPQGINKPCMSPVTNGIEL